ncbi:argininosuccinate lyase [Kwoniella shivajii]|uniref:Arginosuccinase n=1 Tax=Kwoniella shivajii TaxID=564305 RepID=A0ABZ1D7B2_9TREE|nr:argininosuccinate lyase [Kwoniella shivajii]
MDSNADFTKRKLWGGRFTGTTDPLMHKFNASIGYTKKLYKVDLRQSVAYSKALKLAGILNADEAEELKRGLHLVEKEWEDGVFNISSDDEDIFTANERRLSEIIGSGIGGKLHTGRSRNDQTATDARMWLLDQIGDTKAYLIDLINVMTSRAEKEVDALMPGYTHLQKAQPVRWSHWLLSHAHALLSDVQRLSQLIPRISVLPLGSGAMAGNPYGLDRELLAKELGFRSVGQNSMYMVWDRDFVVEFLQWSSLLTNHFSRFAEDLIIYSSGEFGFVTISDAYSTGSSIMPQKKNPDSLELLRGKSGRIFGQMAGLMMTMKGIPTTYNKDMQEDKEPMFDCATTVQDCIRIAEGVIATLDINPEKMRAALSEDMLATDLADYLVRKGVPFRETHHISGRAVAMAEKENIRLSEITFAQYLTLSDQFTEDVYSVFDYENSVEKRNVTGGPSRKGIATQVQYIRAALGDIE